MAALAKYLIWTWFILNTRGQELLSFDCCVKKQVGNDNYTQVAGDTTAFPNCIPDCVYTKDGEGNGQHYCFQKGGAGAGAGPVKCKESTVKSMFVNATINGDTIKIPTNVPGIGNVNCKNQTNGTITCSSDGESGGTSLNDIVEEIGFYYSENYQGILEWISYNLQDTCWHCPVIKTKTNCLCHQYPCEPEVVYVEDSIEVNSTGIEDQVEECSFACYMNGIATIAFPCKFWTLSFFEDKHSTGPHRQKRNHRSKTECGLRNYDASVMISTDQNQYVGFPSVRDVLPTYYKQKVFVYDAFRNLNQNDCYQKCLNTKDCTIWTWSEENGATLCSINKYVPSRRINVRRFKPRPDLVSGCIQENLPENVNCEKLTEAIPDQSPVTPGTLPPSPPSPVTLKTPQPVDG